MVISFKKTVASSLSGWNIIFSVLPLYTGWPDVWLHFEGKRYDRNLYKFNNIYLVISYIFGYITKYLKVSPSYVLIGCLSVCMFVCCLITDWAVTYSVIFVLIAGWLYAKRIRIRFLVRRKNCFDTVLSNALRISNYTYWQNINNVLRWLGGAQPLPTRNYRPRYRRYSLEASGE